MTARGRRYGDKDSHPIPIWNGIFDHYDRVGSAVWTFMWLIDRIPKDGEREGIGKVLGGKPIKISEIVKGMKGSTYKAIRLQLDSLEAYHYICRRRTPYGYVIEVLNSRKWNIWTSRQIAPRGQSLHTESALGGQSDSERLPLRGAEIAPEGRNKENTAVHSSKETQQETAAATFNPWKLLGSDLPMGCPRFQQIFEHYAATRNGNPLSEAMERTIQAANQRRVKVPPPFYEAKRRVERHEVEELAAPDLTGVFCTSGSEREFTQEGRWYADEEIQAGADRNAAAAD